MTVYANGGMNTDYPTATYGDFSVSSTGVDLAQVFLAPTFAFMIAPNRAIGLTALLAYQRFEQNGLQTLGDLGFSINPDRISNNGHDNSFGYGARIGYLGELLPALSIGASFQIKTKMSEFDDYAGLFAEQGDFDIPASWTIGVAVHPSPVLTFVLDVQQIYYSDIKSVGNPMLPNLQNSLLGQDNAAGFGWQDMTVFKAGVQYRNRNGWTWRAGYSFGDQPIPNTEMPFNILAPGVIEQHATIGFTRILADGKEISVAVMHAFSNTVSGPNPLEAPGQQTIELKMNQWEFTVGVGL